MATISFPRKLNTLNDVDLSNESDSDLFAYNSSTSQWYNTKTITSLTASSGISIRNPSYFGNYTSSLSPGYAKFETQGLIPIGSPVGDLLGATTILGGQLTSSMHVSSSQFYGNGSTLTNLTASNIDNFTSDVRKQLSAGSGLNYDAANGVFSLGSGTGTETSTATTTGLTASNQFFIACSGSVTGSVVNVQLPLISTVGDGKNYVIKNIGVGIVNVIASGSNRVDGALSGTLYTTYSSYSLFGTGSNWWIY